MKQLLRELTDTFAPSGHERNMRQLIRREVREFADEVKTDALGNLIVRKRPAGAPRSKQAPARIMITAHIDEIGLVVSHVDANGFVRFAPVGGVAPRNLPGARVRFLNGTAGVIGVEPGDYSSGGPALDRMFIDVGASALRNCPVNKGEVGAFERPFLELRNRIVAKAMNDRVGCLIAIETLRRLRRTANDLYFVFTVQEEVGSRGAKTSAYGVDPDMGFSIDATGWGDTPGIRNVSLELGKGPAIKIRDGGMISDPGVVRWMERTARKNRIPYQREVLMAQSTDARAMQMVRAGVPVGSIGIPCRYIYTPSEMVDLRDVENAIKLVVALLRPPVKLS